MKNFSYNEIKDDYKTSWHIPYNTLLKTLEWKHVREGIIARDNHRCTVCDTEPTERLGKNNVHYRKPTKEELAENSISEPIDMLGDGSWMIECVNAPIVGIKVESPIFLHVHHKYYVLENLPWSYPPDAFITLCHLCHSKIHQSEKIVVYADNSLSDVIKLVPCSRCNGTGFIEEFQYHYEGICFKCDGLKFEEYSRR